MSKASEMRQIPLSQLREAFAEGVLRTTEEGWLAPEQIEDKGYRARYAEICELWTKLRGLVSSMENDLDELPYETDEEEERRVARQAELAEAARDQY